MRTPHRSRGLIQASAPLQNILSSRKQQIRVIKELTNPHIAVIAEQTTQALTTRVIARAANVVVIHIMHPAPWRLTANSAPTPLILQHLITLSRSDIEPLQVVVTLRTRMGSGPCLRIT
jgi:hypothetical protein